MKNYIQTVLAAILLVLTVSACGKTAPSHEQIPASADSASLTGKWTSEDRNGTHATAVVKNDTIKITLDDATTSSLYWQGTFNDNAKDGATIVSAADTEALGRSLLGSQDKKKIFVFKDGDLSFTMSMMGTTTKVELSRG